MCLDFLCVRLLEIASLDPSRSIASLFPQELSLEAYFGLDDCSEASLLWSVARYGVSVPFLAVLLGSASSSSSVFRGDFFYLLCEDY
ncbi:hypothetical protein NPIL_653561 [Nephila pilipes]|uniref:Uncharacterized protein n=1 Tax=Nephila pilipes TaxID=299642 RepID=A0A8X6UDS6_NEPPI|nr:hypothetical protein NPIL_653561 [Nephila pilipes]